MWANPLARRVQLQGRSAPSQAYREAISPGINAIVAVADDALDRGSWAERAGRCSCTANAALAGPARWRWLLNRPRPPVAETTPRTRKARRGAVETEDQKRLLHRFADRLDRAPHRDRGALPEPAVNRLAPAPRRPR
jgi:hypothetical protein